MGCISSKGMSRSMSIHERFSQGLHALAIGVLPGEDFHLSARERDRFITLIKIASGKKLRSFQYVEADDADENLMYTKAPEEQGGEKTKKQPSDSTAELPRSVNPAVGQNAESECRQTDQSFARSFHTLEEFDELVEKIKSFEARRIENTDDGSKSAAETFPLCEDDSDDGGVLSEGKPPDCAGAGWKRKAMGRGLKSLLLPASATTRPELSTVASLKEWIHAGGDIFSADSYVTPKFGSYATDLHDQVMFSPELVAAFEECMQQMEAEELNIVQQMEENESSRESGPEICC
uniref:Uncharacterized protein n=1 Tax=Kalanchoe fedtschenkoi TaxID=63787 RepID=A0A7N0UJR3_KALFE